MRTDGVRGKYSEGESKLYVALELGWSRWKLAFTVGLGERVWETSVAGRDLERMRELIGRARDRFGLSESSRVISCYEAGRDGFWVHRFLAGAGIENVVVDSSSIEVNRRARRAKTDRLDAAKLLSMLVRYDQGEKKVWGVVRVPTVAEEDARQPSRQLRTMKKERTRLINRIKGLLASQGAVARMGSRGLLDPVEAIRSWDEGPLPEGLRARLKSEMERYEFLHRQILDLEAASKKIVREDSSAQAGEIRRLMRLRGVGRVCATIFVREFGWRQFKNRRQVGSLAGLTPTPFQSGDMARERGISRAGNRHIRGIAIDLAWGWLRLQPHSDLSRWYRRRFASGSPRLRKIGIVALARRLLIALWRYSTYAEPPKGALLKPGTLSI